MTTSSFSSLPTKIVQRGIDNGGWHHEPDGAGLLEFFYKIIQGSRTGCAFAFQLLDRVGAAVIHDALVAVFLQAPNHVGAHSPQADHPQLHRQRSSAFLEANIVLRL